MVYVCMVDGVIEYTSTSLQDFNHYRMMYFDDHKDVTDIKYIELTDEEYDAMFAEEIGNE